MMINREEEILDELKKVTRLLSVIATQGLSQRDQIAALARVGFTPKQTAELLGTTANTVSVYLSSIRKGANKNAKS
jgi:DNA-binding CsgD family transcriptional regulator